MKILICITGLFICSNVFAAINPGSKKGQFHLPKEEIEVIVNSKVNLNQEKILLGSIAKVFAKRMKDFNTLSKLEISKFSNNQYEVSLPKQYLEHRIREAVGKKAKLKIYSPQLVVVKRRARVVTDSELRSLLAEQARKQGNVPKHVQLLVNLLNKDKPVVLMRDEELRVIPISSKKSWIGLMSFKLKKYRSGVEVGKGSSMRTNFKWYANEWTSKREIGFHEPLSVDDFELQKKEVMRVSKGRVRAKNKIELTKQLIGTRARRVIRVNSTLSTAMLNYVPDVAVGQEVNVTYVGESGLKITTRAMTLGSGRVGHNIKARLKATKKVVRGKLVSADHLEVRL